MKLVLIRTEEMNRLSLLVVTAILASICSCEKESGSGEHMPKSDLITLQPDPQNGKDAFIEDYPHSDYRNLNWGESDEFAAMSWTSGGEAFVVRSLIDFNFDTLPDKATIDSAELSLFAYGNEYHGYGHAALTGSNECYLQRVVTEWHEHSVTWNEQPQTTEVNQILLPQSNHPMQDYIGMDITDLVKDIYNDPAGSFGFMLRLKNEEGYRRMFFATSDVTEENMRPRLDIYFTLNTD
jgi:hypothetical protein